MDTEALHGLITAVAAGITEAMASENTWETLRHRIAVALGRGDAQLSGRRAAALDEDRPAVLRAREQGDRASEAELRAKWSSRLEEFLDNFPGEETALRELLADLPKSDQPPISTVYQQADSQYGDINQVGRDQTITNDYSQTTDRSVEKTGGSGPAFIVGILVLFLLAFGIGTYYYVDSHPSSSSGSTSGSTTSGGGSGSGASPTSTGSGGTSNGVPAAALSAGANSITGSSTCADWLSADEATQYAAVQRVSVAENSPLASNPFPVQEMKYDCQRNMGIPIARVIWDLETPHSSTAG